jgi:hypothetical protein
MVAEQGFHPISLAAWIIASNALRIVCGVTLISRVADADFILALTGYGFTLTQLIEGTNLMPF